jgi:cell division protease FtsH
MSGDTAKLIDSEIRKLVDGGYDKAKALLKKHKKQLDLLANALLEFETLSGDEIRELITTGKFDRDDNTVTRPSAMPTVGSSIPKAGRGKRLAVGGATTQGV